MLAGIFALVLSAPLLGFGFTFDQGVFSTLADTMLRGGVAYKDAWEHKPPGLFTVYYLAFLLIRRQIWAVRIVEMLAVAVTSAGLWKLTERHTGSRLGAWAASLVFPLTYLSFGQNTAQCESFQLPLIVAALLAWPGPEERAHLARRCFLSGALLSAAILFKTPAVAWGPFFLFERLYRDRRERPFLRKIRLTATWGAGVVAPLLAVASYYWAVGAGEDFFDAIFIYPSRYASLSLGRPYLTQLRGAVEWATWVLPASGLGLILAGVLRGLRVRLADTLRWGFFFLGSLGVVVMQGRYFPYQHLPLVPALAWGTGLLFSLPAGGRADLSAVAVSKPRAVHFVGAAFLAILTIQFFWWIWPTVEAWPGVATFERGNGVSDEKGIWAAQRELARRIRAATAPDDRIYLWGDEPLVYTLADRRMAGKNCHLMHVAPAWGGTERLWPLLDRLRLERPRVIAVCPDKLWWREDRFAPELLEEYPDMKRFIRERYTLVGKFDGYELWRLTD